MQWAVLVQASRESVFVHMRLQAERTSHESLAIHSAVTISIVK